VTREAELAREVRDEARRPGRRPTVPGATVLARYGNGQPSSYSVGGVTLTRRQYARLAARLRAEAG
jgi:hypothetical protein